MSPVRGLVGLGTASDAAASGLTVLADVNLSGAVLARLRDQGVDVVAVRDIMSTRVPDEDIIAEAVRRRAIVVRRDQDFSALLAANGAR